MPENSPRRGKPVGRKFHDKRRRFSPEHRLSQEHRRKHGEHDARQVNRHDDIACVFGKESPRKEDIDRELGAAAHEGNRQYRGDPVPGALERPRGHYGRHRAAESQHKRHERLPVQAESVEELVGQKGGSRHVACIFQDRDAEEEKDDEGHEGKYPANAAYDAVHDEGLKVTGGNSGFCPDGQRRKALAEKIGRILAERKGELENTPYYEEENRQAHYLVHQDFVDDFGDRSVECRYFFHRLLEGAADIAIALFGDDDLRVFAIVF